MIDTGDTVFHRPSEETWLVAGVEGGRLMWCGWPEGTADLSECDLVEKASAEDRLALLHRLANMQGPDMRKSFAIHQLSKEETA